MRERRELIFAFLDRLTALRIENALQKAQVNNDGDFPDLEAMPLEERREYLQQLRHEYTLSLKVINDMLESINGPSPEMD